jgi:hypothetical protein
VADVIPHKKSKLKFPIKPHPILGKMKINYDPTEPLSDEEWPEESR